MNPDHAKILAESYELGSPQIPIDRVYGGILHTMWKLLTAQGIFAVKCLAKTIDITKTDIVKRYEDSEKLLRLWEKMESLHAQRFCRKMDLR